MVFTVRDLDLAFEYAQEAFNVRNAAPGATNPVTLESSGPGSVLKDVIASDFVPVVQLKEVYRQARRSLIVSARHGVSFVASATRATVGRSIAVTKKRDAS